MFIFQRPAYCICAVYQLTGDKLPQTSEKVSLDKKKLFYFLVQIFRNMPAFGISFVYDEEDRRPHDCQRLVSSGSHFLHTHLPRSVHDRRALGVGQRKSQRVHICCQQSLRCCV